MKTFGKDLKVVKPEYVEAFSTKDRINARKMMMNNPLNGKFRDSKILANFKSGRYSNELSDGKPGIYSDSKYGFIISLFDTSKNKNIILVKKDGAEEVFEFPGVTQARTSVLDFSRYGEFRLGAKAVKVNETWDYSDELQEAYERGFQNGFSTALSERDSDTFDTNRLRYTQADEGLSAYIAAFLVFRHEPSVYKFLKKVEKEYFAIDSYSSWADKTLDQVCHDLDNNVYTKEVRDDLDMDKRAKLAYLHAADDFIGDFIYKHNDSPDVDDWTKRTIGDVRKLIGEAKALARKMGLSHSEIAKFYYKPNRR